jgi:HEPN domain-containing protein
MRGHRKDSSYPKDWFKKANNDLKAAEILFCAGNLDTASFHIQQGIEKYLKGFLLGKGWRLKRTHDLVDLLNEAVHYESSFEKFRPFCIRVTECYIEDRYPFSVVSELNKEEVETALKETKEFVRFINGLTSERVSG